MTEQAMQRDQHDQPDQPDRRDAVPPNASPAAPRTAHIQRSTDESTVELELNLDGTGDSQIGTGVRFYDHMLASLAKHSLIDLRIQATGDVDVDAHHTVEDVAIVLGDAFKEALRVTEEGRGELLLVYARAGTFASRTSIDVAVGDRQFDSRYSLLCGG